MSFSYVGQDELKAKYEKTKACFVKNFAKLDDYERLAEAEPRDVKSGQPDVADSTTASYLETRPKAIVQKTPTGKIKLNPTKKESKGEEDGVVSLSDKEEIFDQLIENVILPNATTGGSVINKAISIVRKGMVYGSCPALCFIRNDDFYFGADFQILNIRDVYFEPGKNNAPDCNYMFLNAYYTEGDIDAIIAHEKALSEDEDYTPVWDFKKLDEIKAKAKEKDMDSLSHQEKSEGASEGGYIKLVHLFQKGKKAKFYTFDPETGDVIRSWENPDPRGMLPIRYFYFQQDIDSPIGKSAIRLTARLQNMLDKHLQNYQYAVAMKSAPPIKIRGGIDTDSIKFEPYAVWDMGDNPNNDASVVNTDNTLINVFPQVRGALKNDILNITNNGDTSISAETGGPGWSKTPAGVKAQQMRVDVNDNYLRRQFEDFYSDLLETMVNLHIAAHLEAKDKDIVPLSKRFIENKKEQNPHYDTESDEIDYAKLSDVMARFRVDASSSKIDDDTEQLESLNNLLVMRLKAGESVEPYLKIAPLIRQIVKKSGVPEVDEISPKESELNREPVAPQIMPEDEPAQIPVQLGDSMGAPEVEPSPIYGAKEIRLFKELKRNGLSDKQAEAAIVGMKQGYSPAEMDQFLKGGI